MSSNIHRSSRRDGSPVIPFPSFSVNVALSLPLHSAGPAIVGDRRGRSAPGPQPRHSGAGFNVDDHSLPACRALLMRTAQSTKKNREANRVSVRQLRG
jgi:hypothetical protein